MTISIRSKLFVAVLSLFHWLIAKSCARMCGVDVDVVTSWLINHGQLLICPVLAVKAKLFSFADVCYVRLFM